MPGPKLIPYRVHPAEAAAALRTRDKKLAQKKPWLLVYFKDELLPHYALIDSGAHHSMVPKAIARRVGFVYDESREETGLATGGTFKFHQATNRLQIRTEADR